MNKIPTELQTIMEKLDSASPSKCPELYGSYRGLSVPSEIEADASLPLIALPTLIGTVITLSGNSPTFALLGIAVSISVATLSSVFFSKASRRKSMRKIPEAIDSTCNYRYLESTSWERAFRENKYVVIKKHLFKYENKDDNSISGILEIEVIQHPFGQEMIFLTHTSRRIVSMIKYPLKTKTPKTSNPFSEKLDSWDKAFKFSKSKN